MFPNIRLKDFVFQGFDLAVLSAWRRLVECTRCFAVVPIFSQLSEPTGDLRMSAKDGFKECP